MDKYEQIAREWWEKNQPSSFNRMQEPDRTAFFKDLGERIQDEITLRAFQTMHETKISENFTEAVAQRSTIQHNVEREVLDEMLYYLGSEETEEEMQEAHEEKVLAVVRLLLRCEWEVEMPAALQRGLDWYPELTEEEVLDEWRLQVEEVPSLLPSDWKNPPQDWDMKGQFGRI